MGINGMSRELTTTLQTMWQGIIGFFVEPDKIRMRRASAPRRDRPPEKRKSLRARWLVNNLSVMALILVCVDLVCIYGVQTFYYTTTQQKLQTELTSVVNLLTRYAEDSDTNVSSEIRSTLEGFSAKDKMELMAISTMGKIVLTSSGFSPSDDSDMPDYTSLLQGGTGYWTGKSENGENIMALCMDISTLGSEYSAVRVVVSLTEVDDAIFTLAMLSTCACIVILLLLTLMGVYFLGSIVHPVMQLSSSVGKFAQGDFSFRIRYRGNDEIGDFCSAINHMADELSNAETMKNEFISSVSHELRTPLTAIKGWAETVYLDQDPDTCEKGMRVIIHETERLSQMVEELLDFSRIQSGHFTLHSATMDVLAELGDAVLMYGERARREGVEILYDEPEMLPFVYGDKNRIRQVFLNIIDNAVKYSNPGGKVTIQALEHEGWVRVIVIDTGLGIKESDLSKVKTKFYKANHTRRGSGIGLAVADEIITAHGGTLMIQSREGEGTRVTIDLPPQSEE